MADNTEVGGIKLGISVDLSSVEKSVTEASRAAEEQLTKSFKSATNTIEKNVTDTSVKIKSTVGKVSEKLNPIINDLKDKIGASLTETESKVKPLVTNVAEQIQSAFGKLDSRICKTDQELQSVTALLDFDPSNTVLLSQKQDLLAQSVENARRKLEALNTTKAKVNSEFQAGKIGAEDFREYQRQVIGAEQELKQAEDALHDFGQTSEKETDKAAADIKSVGNNFGSASNVIRKHSDKMQSGINKNLTSISAKAKNTANNIKAKLGGALSKIGIAAATAFSAYKLIDFGKECTDLGSDLAEVQNVVDVTFASLSSKVDDFAKNAVTDYGLSETMAKQYTGLYGAMAKAFGYTESQAYDMSTALTGLAGDVASFYNISQDEAYTKLKSVFSGETETLKDLGVVMTQNALDAYALANGYGKTTAKMTEAEKVSLRYAFVQEQLAAAQGDFARTSDSWANQTRMLKLNFDSLKATLGQSFINVLTPLLRTINSIIERLQVAAQAFADFTAKFFGGSGEGNGAGNAAAETADALASATSSAESLSSAADDITTEVKDAATEAKKLQNQLAGFDELNILQLDEGDADSENEAYANANTGAVMPITCDTGALNKQLEESNGLLDKLKEKMTVLSQKTGFDKLVGKCKSLGAEIAEQISRYNFGEALSKALENGITFAISALNLAAGIIFPIAIALDIPGIVYESINTISQLFATLGQVITAITPGVEQFVNIGLVPIATWIGDKIRDALQFCSDQLKKVGDWFTDHTDMFTSLGTQLGEATAKIWAFWEPIADTVWEVFKNLIDQLVDIFLQLAEKVGVLAGKFLEVWDAVYSWLDSIGVVQAISDTVMGIITWLGDGISKVFENIGNIIGVFLDVLGHLCDFVTGVFAGDWEKAWNAIKDIVATVWDGIWSSIKAVCNTIIDGINGLWTGIYNAVKGIVDSIGSVSGALGDLIGQDWHFSMPSEPPLIPKLAKGGIVKAPTLAMVGDNPNAARDPEVISPLSKLQGMISSNCDGQDTQILRQILAYIIKLYDLMLALVNGGGDVIEFVAELDGDPIFQKMIQKNKEYKKQHGGKSAFI